ncbi:Crp/Fnr family transcriptional regulator [Sphingopyxis panaciterrulae]|uniref:CRP-like cAMP-binding protein n=1 Tax=Sphingopyxis panaciterrulae TaxID=462372 RepID=A0A7W9B7X5_9SPHN|nr:Crp/Fnr family transcriptional regulator [Sphingopyxis panaciterrulae]MBB5707494.1 CRP-like cAMP-binding protein [Sphingopyxis panaciterrulae]
MDALIRRLSFYSDLDDADRADLATLRGTIRNFRAHSEIITAGQEMDAVLVMREGWAARFKTLEDGRRQILNILLPGDIFDLQVLVAAEADHSVVTVTDGSLYAVAPAAVRKMLAGSGPLTMAFWWTQVQEEAFLREQIVRNGRQTAQERIGHLLLELHRRAQIVDQASADAMPLPLTQTQIADTLGLTPIHTNRVLRRLVRAGLIEMNRQWIRFLAPDRLAEMCDFDPGYFHLDAFRMRLARR